MERAPIWSRDWAGLQVGGTLWMAICAGVVSSSNMRAAVGLLACAFLANVIAFLSFKRIALWGAPKACRISVLGIGAAGLLATFLLDQGQLVEEVGLPAEIGAWPLYATVILVTVLLLRQFRVRPATAS